MLLENNSFVFPIGTLENSRMRLVEFDLETHGPAFIDSTRDHPELFDYMPIGPYKDLKDLNAFLKSRIFASDAAICFAIMLKPTSTTETETFAGTVGYLNSSLDACVAEIGFITILPKYHGTFVAKNAAGLLLTYALDPLPLGLGLRRCEWQCHAANEASSRFAQKMLFTFEGTKRFERVMPIGKMGNGYEAKGMPNPFGKEIGQSRDTAIYAHYCDEWAQKRPDIIRLMDRV